VMCRQNEVMTELCLRQKNISMVICATDIPER
jgi:hypothetical protein